MFSFYDRWRTRKKIAELQKRADHLRASLERHGPEWKDRASALKVVSHLEADIALMTPHAWPQRGVG